MSRKTERQTGTLLTRTAPGGVSGVRDEKGDPLSPDEASQRIAQVSSLNQEMARVAARWAVEQAKANWCGAIVLEDLASLEIRGMGTTMNGKVSPVVRRQLLVAIQSLAAQEGIQVVLVAARGTSSGCPRCARALAHIPSSDRQKESGYAWALCRSCGHTGDRDDCAAERIGMRGLVLLTGTASSTKQRTQRTVSTQKTQDLEVVRIRARRPKGLPQLHKRRQVPHVRRQSRAQQVRQQAAPRARSAGSPSPGGRTVPVTYLRTGPGKLVRQPGKDPASVHPLDGTRYALWTQSRLTPVRPDLVLACGGGQDC
jgi:IS605 OrfB family transposase